MKGKASSMCAALALCACVLAPRARADMDESTLASLVKQKKLGLSQDEEQQALLALNDPKVTVDLNKVSNARGAASGEFRSVTMDSLANPFDGSAPMSGGSFDEDVPPVPGGVAIDPRTGKPKKKDPRQQAGISAGGQCSEYADQAVKDLQRLVRDRVSENSSEALEAGGAYSDFFSMLGELFFPREREKKFEMPTVTTGKTVTETAIATYHSGGKGFITFDCEKFSRYGTSMRRKIACHEFFHWYQDRINALEEPSAYAVMPHC